MMGYVFNLFTKGFTLLCSYETNVTFLKFSANSFLTVKAKIILLQFGCRCFVYDTWVLHN